MPWTVDNPPAVARNRTEEERRRCVAAANAVLERGGTEEEAIFACIRAAGRAEEGKGMSENSVTTTADALKAEEQTERERLHEEQERRAKRYGIAPKPGGHLTPPAGYPEDEDQYGDPVNYKYPAAAASRLLDAEYEYRDGRVVRKEEKSLAVKVIGETDDALKVAGWGVVFGGRDLEGDTFEPDTDFWLDRPPGPRPVLYEHSFNVPGLTVLGQAKVTKTDEGLWMEAELDRHNEYVRMLEKLIEKGVLGWSSGAVSHLVRRDGNKIVSWPIAEFSLTPTPAEPRTLGVAKVRSIAEVQPALKSLLPEDGEEAPSVEGSAENEAEEQSCESENSGGEAMSEFNLDELAAKVAEQVAQSLGPEVKAGVVTADERPDYLKTFNLWLRGEVKGMAEGSGPTGGYLVPPEYSDELVKELAESSIMRRIGARVIRTSSNTVYVPRLVYGNAATIVGEEGAYPEVEPTLAQEAVTLYKFGRLAKVSEELLADSMVDIWRDVLQPDFVQAFAAAENTYFTTGTGTGQPEGVLTGAEQGVVAASASAITADEILELYHSLDYLYRQNAVWMAHDSTILAIRQLKDSNGQYLWQPGLQAGQPDMLLGRPVITNNAMPEITNDAKVLLFGDFRYFYIYEQPETSVQRLDELYAATGQIGFRAFRRVGSIVILPAAFKYLQMAAV